MSTAPDLADPRWFPVDLHVPDRRFSMLHLDDEVIDRSSFLDTRIEAVLANAVPVPVKSVKQSGRPEGTPRVAWLFHTSFCASTLLARALHLPPFEISLKEPFVLRRLADARHSRWSLDGLIDPTVRLLARPWHPGGAVLIKPTHVALNIAIDLIKATAGSRAVILTCSLDEFLVSNLKKPADSQAKIPLLVERALKAGSLGARLPPTALKPPDLVCAAGLQWAAQRELMQDVIDAVGPERIRAMDMRSLLAAPAEAVSACAQWLQLPAPRDALLAHTAKVALRNAKALQTPYSSEQRAREANQVAQHHSEMLAAARVWLEAQVLPAMRPLARTDPNAL